MSIKLALSLNKGIGKSLQKEIDVEIEKLLQETPDEIGTETPELEAKFRVLGKMGDICLEIDKAIEKLYAMNETLEELGK
jgi:hypothetical protein